MNKFLKKIKLLNNNWTNNSQFSIKSVKEIDLKPIQLKALIKYEFETEIKKEKRFGAEPPSCSSKNECKKNIHSHQENFLNKNDKEFLKLIPKQTKERKPNLKDKWTSIKREETYIENCHTCNAKGFIDCNGNQKITCHDCKGHKQFTFSETIYLNVISNTELNWNEKTTPEWMNSYFKNELSDNPSHIELMKYSTWHSHTFNLGSFEKGHFFASIQGNIEPFEVIYTDNNSKEFNCRYIHKSLIPYEMDYIFDDYINDVCNNIIEKNSVKHQKYFFKNKIIKNIVNEKSSSIPAKSKIISSYTKQKIKKTFKDFSEENLEEQKNIDLRDVFYWTSISFISIYSVMFFISLFSQNTINWNYISLPYIIENIPNTVSHFSSYVKNNPLNIILFLIGNGLISFGLQKVLGSAKKSIFRYLCWFFNFSIISFLLFFNLLDNFSEANWIINFNNIGESFSSIFSITFDILLISSLIGILKAIHISYFKIKNIYKFLNN